MRRPPSLLDAVVIGGGPAGLSGALLLGRCRRSVVVVDAGRPRNAWAENVRGFFTRDGTPPATLLRLGREQLRRYPTVRVVRGVVERAARERDGTFAVTLAGGRALRARAVLLATGVVDELPTLDGLVDCFGRSVFVCPYCDAFEVSDRRLAALGKMPQAASMAVALRAWSADVVLFAQGARVPAEWGERLAALGVEVVREPVRALEHRRGRLARVRLRGGGAVARDALFLATGQRKRSRLARDLGCRFTDAEAIEVSEGHRTCVDGVYAAGDATPDSQFVVVAAAEGARAAVSIHQRLSKQDVDVAVAAAASASSRSAR